MSEPFAWLKDAIKRTAEETKRTNAARPTCTCDGHTHCKHGQCCHCSCKTRLRKSG